MKTAEDAAKDFGVAQEPPRCCNCYQDIKMSFLAGAAWQKEQLEKEIASLREQLQWSIKNERQYQQMVFSLRESLLKTIEKTRHKDSPL